MVTETPNNLKETATLKISVAKITDIHDKLLKYLVIENQNGGKAVINVGEKTFENVLKLINDKNEKTNPVENQLPKQKTKK